MGERIVLLLKTVENNAKTNMDTRSVRRDISKRIKCNIAVTTRIVWVCSEPHGLLIRGSGLKRPARPLATNARYFLLLPIHAGKEWNLHHVWWISFAFSENSRNNGQQQQEKDD